MTTPDKQIESGYYWGLGLMLAAAEQDIAEAEAELEHGRDTDREYNERQIATKRATLEHLERRCHAVCRRPSHPLSRA